MFEKIDGKDQFFQQFGADGLLATAWRRDKTPGWDMLLYVLGGAAEAHAVFQEEAQSEGISREAGDETMLAAGWLAACRGRYYIEMAARDAKADPLLIVPLKMFPPLIPCGLSNRRGSLR
jgi:hypothetical protein